MASEEYGERWVLELAEVGGMSWNQAELSALNAGGTAHRNAIAVASCRMPDCNSETRFHIALLCTVTHHSSYRIIYRASTRSSRDHLCVAISCIFNDHQLGFVISDT